MRLPVANGQSFKLSTSGRGSVPCSLTGRIARKAFSVKAQAVVAPEKAASNGAPAAQQADSSKHASFASRHMAVMKHFPTAISSDDLIGRVEVALAGFGFTGDNSIAMTNLCRDEVTLVLKDKIEAVYGSSFNTNGLGAILTCGVTGIGAGLSHSPVCDGGRERYVFFSFPHIAIDSNGEVGAICRPGRPAKSGACGALMKCLGELKKEGVEAGSKVPGVHDPLEPEYSILKQRLARRVRYEGSGMDNMDLVGLTQVAERTITDDLEYLISKTVDTSRSDYAVITGVQIHNWGSELTEDGPASLEFVAPTRSYVVIEGQKTHLDLTQVPSLSPRQLHLLLRRALQGEEPGQSQPGCRSTVITEVPLPYLTKKLGGALPNSNADSKAAAAKKRRQQA